VREASQEALCSLVGVVGRELAPYLRNLMGCWLASHCDMYAPVASMAKQALNKAFPMASKQAEAITHCKDAVIMVRRLHI